MKRFLDRAGRPHRRSGGEEEVRPASLGHCAREVPFRDDAYLEIGVPGGVAPGTGGFLEFDFGGAKGSD